MLFPYYSKITKLIPYKIRVYASQPWSNNTPKGELE